MDPTKQSAASHAPPTSTAADPDAMSLGDPSRRYAALVPPPQPHVLTRTALMYATPTSASDLAAMNAAPTPPPLPHVLTRTAPLHAAPVTPPLPQGFMRTASPDDVRSRFDQLQIARQCWPPQPPPPQGRDEGSLFGGAYSSPFSFSYNQCPTGPATSHRSVEPQPCIAPATPNPCITAMSRTSSSASKQSTANNSSSTKQITANNSSSSKQITGSNYGSQSTDSRSDLAVYFNAMRLRDPSPSQREQLQQRFAAPNSPPLIRPLQPQAIAPTPPLQMAQQHYPQPQPQRYGGDQASSASPFGSYNLNLTTPSTSRPPVEPLPCTLSTSFSSHSSVAPFISTASSWASQSSTGDHPFGAAASSVLDYDYCDMLLNSLRDTEAGASTWWCYPPIRQCRTLEEIRSDLLRGPMEYSLTMFPETSAHLVNLLEEGGKDIRMSVLAGVKRHVRRIMDNQEVHPVFLALLHACEGQFYELQEIVKAVVSPNGGEMQSARNRNRAAALKALITAVAPYRKLCGMLVNYFVREGLLQNSKGDEVLHHCFTTMSYEDTSILIRFAIINFDNIFLCQSGSKCLVECFVNARNMELLVLEDRLLSQAKKIAKGPYSNYFMQRVLEHGREELKRRVVELFMEDVVSLSRDASASYVVEACFLSTESPALLLRVLSAFLGLHDDQLAELVQCERGNYVVHKLVARGKGPFPDETLALARRIARLPPAVLRQEHALQVMRIIKRLFRHRLD